ncbi:MAG: HAD family hydrolase [Mesorhizobium sp.]|nr:HAD family hydrolase [bacterium M00.F.Ca.ET.205.01.1.1]TGU54348.1 HAD family hydrolase [bacterium M00.F.Ca.ET.152.01.1.1]TGV38860.1 HAD family hydrolase [Mesorhizobium sp. M00.F.Ca.ET.186.01.1.1]TGZ43921.1 HAD family hydrolase [bacterium M00.F.Ca.ET.162.01.1.1]TJW32755.1 MAG: HAD family hydrolase [Mesorhizobium sp.]
MTPELVIFDCDGVLVDSEALSVSALLGMIALAGGTVSEEVAYEHFLGKSMKSVREILLRDFGLGVTDSHLTAMRVELMRRFREELKPIPGVKEMLPRLGLPYCVASSGTLDRIRYSLDVTGLLKLMEPHLFSAGMVKHGKPAPDLFLYAAAAMRAHPGNCLVIEDSPAGIAAAKAAGMRVLAFTGGSHAGNPALKARLASSEPDSIFADMLQLPELIAGLGARRAS